jgi:hypothetical protein
MRSQRSPVNLSETLPRETDVHRFISKHGILTACFAPAVVYVLLNGRTIHFAYLFGVFMVTKVGINLARISKLRSSSVARETCNVRGNPDPRRTHTNASIRSSKPTIGTPSPSAASRARATTYQEKAQLIPTIIASREDPVLKMRRALLNKVSPDKLVSVCEKLVRSFDSDPFDSRDKELHSLVTLVFSAASRQPQYIGVFAELLQMVFNELTNPENAMVILTGECQSHWSGICLQTVESRDAWSELSEDDKADMRTRHRLQQLTVAEFCGLLASLELIQPCVPLSWLESLLFPVCVNAERRGALPKGSETEMIIEIVSACVRGMGPSEAEFLFTDLDQDRFGRICDTLFTVPPESSRVRCLLQELQELRESGWSDVPNWKKALKPTKRGTSQT